MKKYTYIFEKTIADQLTNMDYKFSLYTARCWSDMENWTYKFYLNAVWLMS